MKKMQTRIKELEAKVKPRKKRISCVFLEPCDDTSKAIKDFWRGVDERGERHLYAKRVFFFFLPNPEISIEEWEALGAKMKAEQANGST